MQNKLDPRQYTPYALNVPSGNLSFSLGANFFNCYLLEALTGSFNISGSLKINGGEVASISTTNDYGGTNVSIFNSINSFATGQSNSIISSDSSRISGDNNGIFGGSDNIIGSSVDSNIFGGRNVVMSHTGASILADGKNSRLKESVADHSLTIDFESGLFIKNSAFINGSLYVTGGSLITNDILIGSSNSGFFSGNIQVLGTAYNTGSPYQNLQNLRDTSGSLSSLNSSTSGVLNTNITGLSGAFDLKGYNTGAILLSMLSTASGELKSDYDAKLSYSVKTTGVQNIAGIKTFQESTNYAFLSGDSIISSGAFILGKGRYIPASFNALGRSGQISWGNRNVYVCTGDNAWARIYITGW